MRLLLRSENGDLSLTKDFAVSETIPPYAILSHTWEEGQEVTYQDFMESTGQNKNGYDKIRFCGEQAHRDGLQYFWVDTCCFDKTNHVELRTAINSMFRWYLNAEKCYVYLQDVSASKRKAGGNAYELPWEPSFRVSRWFTRGWTLQELLAPTSVEFFSREWKFLGDKKSLRQQIHNITGIPDSALEGAPLSQFSVNDRFLWRENRNTKLEEDQAYSLLGLFGVYIAPIYGEGKSAAFERLRQEINKHENCVRDLHLTDPRDDKKRIEDTKGGLLENSYRWILHNPEFLHWRDNPESRLLWIKGDPGKGKTMLLCGIANELQKLATGTHLLSYFFCQATDMRINTATAVLRGLLYLLVIQQPLLISHVRKKYDHTGRSFFQDSNAWVALSDVFANMLRDPCFKSTFLLVDALDECIEGLPKLLDFISKTSLSYSRVKWIVSGRNWPIIEERLKDSGHGVRLSLELNARSVSIAVNGFIHHKVDRLAEQKSYNTEIRRAVLDHLLSNAQGTFLWVALVCQSLQEVANRHVLKKLNDFPPGLDLLYERMMQYISNSNDADVCKQILALAAIVYRPVVLEEMIALVEQLDETAGELDIVKEIIGNCGSFLTLREGTIYFIHQSAKDFISTKGLDEILPLGLGEAHAVVFRRSLRVMSALQRDIYQLHDCASSVEEGIKRPDPDPLGALRYSCSYWIDHLVEWNSSLPKSVQAELQDGGALEEFIQVKYLNWLESLSLCQSISKGIISIAKLSIILQESPNSSSLQKLVYDAHRFVMYHKKIIESHPLQTYASALLFSPKRSIIRQLFEKEAPDSIIIHPSMQDEWDSCLQTLEGHNYTINSVAFSHDSSQLASVSFGEMKVWNSISGECLYNERLYKDKIMLATFSLDSTQLIILSDDYRVQYWNLSSGKCVLKLEYPGAFNGIPWCSAVAFSHDSAQLAFSCDSEYGALLTLWNMDNRKCMQPYFGQGSVEVLCFSHDSKRLATASTIVSTATSIRIWDTEAGTCLKMLNEINTSKNSGNFRSIAFAHDSTQIVTSSAFEIVAWDLDRGERHQTINEGARSIALSHDSLKLAAASYHNTTVKIWDMANGTCLQTLEGHFEHVTSLSFSHDSRRLASVSLDTTVKIWDVTEIQSPLKEEVNEKSSSECVAISHDSMQIALSRAPRNQIELWDVGSGKLRSTLRSHSHKIHSIKFSHSSSLLAAASAQTIWIWDLRTGTCLRTLFEQNTESLSFVFSHDSTKFASLSDDWTVRVRDLSSFKILSAMDIKGKTFHMKGASFSHDVRLLAIDNGYGIQLWDINRDECKRTLENHGRYQRNSVAFFNHSKWLASMPEKLQDRIEIWDVNTGDSLYRFIHFSYGVKISFDMLGPNIYTESGTIDVCTLDPSKNTRTRILSYLPCHTLRYRGLGLERKGGWITHNSEKLFILPWAYRPQGTTYVVSEKVIALVDEFGKLWMYMYKLDSS